MNQLAGEESPMCTRSPKAADQAGCSLNADATVDSDGTGGKASEHLCWRLFWRAQWAFEWRRAMMVGLRPSAIVSNSGVRHFGTERITRCQWRLTCREPVQAEQDRTGGSSSQDIN